MADWCAVSAANWAAAGVAPWATGKGGATPHSWSSAGPACFARWPRPAGGRSPFARGGALHDT